VPDVPLWRLLPRPGLVIILDCAARHVLEVNAKLCPHYLAADVLNNVFIVKLLIDLNLFLNKNY
jgi:hypothetical protein